MERTFHAVDYTQADYEANFHFFIIPSEHEKAFLADVKKLESSGDPDDLARWAHFEVKDGDAVPTGADGLFVLEEAFVKLDSFWRKGQYEQAEVLVYKTLLKTHPHIVEAFVNHALAKGYKNPIMLLEMVLHQPATVVSLAKLHKLLDKPNVLCWVRSLCEANNIEL